MIPTHCDLYRMLEKLLEGQQALAKKVADIATDLTNLVSAVTAITADVQAVLAKLAAMPNITPDQVAQLEAQITALQQADSALKAALP